MKEKWFKNYGWVYLPIHFMGVLVSLAAVAFMIPVVIAIDRHAHSVSDEFYQLFVYATCVAFWWKWVAEKAS